VLQNPKLATIKKAVKTEGEKESARAGENATKRKKKGVRQHIENGNAPKLSRGVG